MGTTLTIQEKDNVRIEFLRQELNIAKKIDVIRAALTLMEKEADRIKRWKNAVRLVTKNSEEINKEFQPHSSMKINSYSSRISRHRTSK